MPDLVVVLLLGLAGSGLVGVAGLLVLGRLQGRSVTAHIAVLLATTVLAVVAGVVAVAQAMFISEHDLDVLLVVLVAAGAVSLVLALWSGRRLAKASVWAAEARERERRLEDSRRQLVAWVSHDLRTPLAGLRAMAEALEDGVVDDPATVSNYHRRMRVETDRVSGLVDDLFELSRINAGALRITLQNVPLAEVVSDAVAAAAPVASAKRVRLEAAPSGYGTVRGSEPELGRVLANLLLNAIGHTPADGVVRVDGGSDARGGWVAVTDGCGGIPESDLPRVFDVAFRGAAARSPSSDVVASTGGGGLGLAIVRGLVDIHDGEVAVANTDGGCRFTVRLPAAV
ncbi:MAG: sensor histidine kinase [Acidimicrobiales bacterium]